MCHKGFDEPSRFSRDEVIKRREELTQWAGAGTGTVIAKGPLHEKKKKDGSHGAYVGQFVTIKYVDADGHVWESTTMHHAEILVNAGDTVMPQQPIAKGSGFGDQFASPRAGDPHVHWEVKLDGEPVHPATGLPYDYVFPPKREKETTTPNNDFGSWRWRDRLRGGLIPPAL